MTLDSVPELARRVLHLETLVKRSKPADGLDNAALSKRLSALESAVTKLSAPAPTKAQAYTSMPTATVPKPADRSLALKFASIKEELRLLWTKAHKAGIYADTYYDDLQYQMVGQKMTSPSAHITYGTNGDYILFAKTCDWNDDWLTMVIQMSHRWKTGSVIYPHLHWVQTAAAMPNLLIAYRWNVNGAATNAAAWTSIIHSANAYTWSTGSLNQITKFGSITPPAGAGLSDLVHIKIFRDVANESTLFTGGAENDGNVQDDVAASSFDIHFELDSAGSDTEYTK